MEWRDFWWALKWTIRMFSNQTMLWGADQWREEVCTYNLYCTSFSETFSPTRLHQKQTNIIKLRVIKHCLSLNMWPFDNWVKLRHVAATAAADSPLKLQHIRSYFGVSSVLAFLLIVLFCSPVGICLYIETIFLSAGFYTSVSFR